MVTLELSKKDAATLRDVLESARAELKTERVRTERKEFHAELVRREKLVGNIIGLLESSEEEV